MNPATLQRRPRAGHRTTVVPHVLAEDLDACPDTPRTTPFAHLEPQGEGILFAILSILCSVLLYAGVLLAHALL